MKFLSALIAFVLSYVLSVCSANILDTASKNTDSKRYFFFSGDDDKEVILVDSTEPVDEEFIKKYTSDPDNHGYWLYTRGNPLTPQILRYKDNSTVINLNFNKDTVFLSHGWKGSCNSEINTMLTEAFLQVQDVNVIVLDWSSLAGQNYLTAKEGVPAVGRGLGQFISWLVTLGASYEKLHLVGFSLGGHVVGNAGKETGGKVKRITALDPAGPLWLLNPERLNKSDGQYVEVIHTTLLLGHYEPCGDTDFYPNDGIIQPGCIFVPCSHSRAYELMAASIKYNNFKACSDMTEMARNDCNGEVELMGNADLMKKRSGIYRLNTKGSYPFQINELGISMFI